MTWSVGDDIVFEKYRFQTVFCPHEIEKPACSNSSGLKKVFEKLCFSDGLVWTVNFSGEVWTLGTAPTYEI